MDAATGLYDIYGLWHVPFWHTRWFLITSGIIVFCIVAALIFFIISIKRQKLQKIPYWQRALMRMQELLASPMASSEQGYQVYGKLVFALKEYLAERYHFPAHAMTDDELLAFLAGIACPSEILQLLERILKGGVEIRFAGQKTYHDAVVDAINNAIVIIKGTIPEASQA